MHISEIPLILLAGGASTRMGIPKGLIKAGDGPWLLRQIQWFPRVGGAQVIVVLGHDQHIYRSVIPWLSGQSTWRQGANRYTVQTVTNRQPQRGTFSSLQVGLRAALQSDAPAVFVMPMDVPAPVSSVLYALISGAKGAVQAVVPKFKGKSGHPVLIMRPLMEQLCSLSPDAMRLDHALAALPAENLAHVDVDDARVAMNLNTPSDWHKYWDEFGQHSSNFY